MKKSYFNILNPGKDKSQMINSMQAMPRPIDRHQNLPRINLPVNNPDWDIETFIKYCGGDTTHYKFM